MNTETESFNKKPNSELGQRLGLMKSAAVQMLASKYDKGLESKSPFSETEFESSTNNLINTTKQKLQNLDNFIQKTDREYLPYNNDKNRDYQQEKYFITDQPTSDFRKTEKFSEINRNSNLSNSKTEYNQSSQSSQKQYTSIGLKQFSNKLEEKETHHIKPDFNFENRLRIDGFCEINENKKITTNFMENELQLLQEKIAGLEKKLTNNAQLSFNRTETLKTNDSKSETSNKAPSRLEINLNENLRLAEKQEIKRKDSNSSFHSEIVTSASKQIKSGRRAESVALTNRKKIPNIKSELSNSKQDLNNSVSRKNRKSGSKQKSRISRIGNDSDTNSRVFSSSKKRVTLKSYMKPTEISMKKNTKSSSNTIQQRSVKKSLYYTNKIQNS